MAKDNSKDPATPQPQSIPLSKIHDLPGVFISKQPEKSYGGLVTSIQANGVKEPVVLRLREDGEYQLVTGYRRRKASELAKKPDIPALVYQMSIQEAQDYFHRVKNQPNMAIPGKPVPAPDKGQSADLKGTEKPTTAAPAAGDNPKGQDKPTEGTEAPTADPKDKGKDTAPKTPAPPADDKSKGQDKPAEDPKAPVADPKGKGKDTEPQAQVPAPAADDKAKGQDKPTEGAKAPAADPQDKGKDTEPKAAAPAAGDKPKEEDKPAEGAQAPATDHPQGKGKDTDPKAQAAVPAADDKAKGQDKPAEGAKTPAADPQGKGKDSDPKVPAAGDKAKDEGKPAKGPSDDFSDVDPAAVRANLAEHGIVDGKVVDKDKLGAAPIVQQAMEDVKKGQSATTPAPEKPAAPAKAPEPAPIVTGPAAKGPAGTIISQVLPERLSPPDEAAKKDFPAPKEGESIFVTLHPAYLVKSEYNTISVDPKSEDYQELKKSIELNGVKDPVLARIGDAGTLEIVSGQRRHMIATELNYPVPTIIQKISVPDVKILVADGNLHRPKISTYDLARSLRMKMEGMKQKAGRRKKGSFKAEELDSDAKLAQEMGMPVSKLNRLIRLSEATKDVCDRVDDNSLTLSVANALSFLTPEHQDKALHLMDLGYKLPTERIEYMKKVEKAGKLDEQSMRAVLDGKNVLDKPQQTTSQASEPTQPSAPAASTIPQSPDVPQPTTQPGAAPEGPAPAAPSPAAPADGKTGEDQEPLKGGQERPEYTKVVLAGDRLRKYFPDVMMTPREIEDSIYEALEERRQRQQKEKEKLTIFPKRGPKH